MVHIFLQSIFGEIGTLPIMINSHMNAGCELCTALLIIMIQLFIRYCFLALATRFAIIAARAPAPIPLSILTTARPGVQDWSIDMRAA